MPWNFYIKFHDFSSSPWPVWSLSRVPTGEWSISKHHRDMHLCSFTFLRNIMSSSLMVKWASIDHHQFPKHKNTQWTNKAWKLTPEMTQGQWFCAVWWPWRFCWPAHTQGLTSRAAACPHTSASGPPCDTHLPTCYPCMHNCLDGLMVSIHQESGKCMNWSLLSPVEFYQSFRYWYSCGYPAKCLVCWPDEHDL